MLVKLRPSTVYGAVAGGVFVQTPGESFTLKLPAPLVEPACAWIRALEEPRTTDELVAATGNPKAAPFVERVVAQLRSHGALVDAYDVPPGVPEAAVAYVESYSDRPQEALNRLAAAQVTVTGPTALTAAAEASLAERGVAVRTVADGTEPDTGEWTLTISQQGLRVRLEPAGARLWVASSGLADPVSRAALRARLAVPGEPGAVAAGLAAGLAAEQAFRELTGLAADGARTVHIVDSRPLGWRSVELRPAAGPADGPGPVPAMSGPGADELIGCHRHDTPVDWPQLPVCVGRVVPGPGRPDASSAVGWGRTRGEADQEALRAFLRGGDPAGGAGATEDVALLDAALRLAAAERVGDAQPEWVDGVADERAEDGTGWRYRVHETAVGLVLAEAEYRADGAVTERGPWRGSAWGLDRAGALESAADCARARAQLSPHSAELARSLGVDCRIAADVARERPDTTAVATALLGYEVAFRAAEPDALLGAAPLACGVLVRIPRGVR
ncbi:hypothetical protein OG239_19810 [Streptomyces sp. NBC_00868]|uniref:hypothetical protein n=1 Tax=unclassified Streptomyces TaxID=2593676 RepID=UPI0032566E12|nr:hypothetical protein OG239_19810 [Streptomyces sp. NBC_00868]